MDHPHSVVAVIINNSSKNEIAHILLTHSVCLKHIIWCFTVQEEKISRRHHLE